MYIIHNVHMSGRSHANFLWIRKKPTYTGQNVVDISPGDNMISTAPNPITQTGTISLNHITSDNTNVDIVGGTTGSASVRLPLLDLNKTLLASKTVNQKFLAVDDTNNSVGYAIPTVPTSTWAQTLTAGNNTGENSEAHVLATTTWITGSANVGSATPSIITGDSTKITVSSAIGSDHNSGQINWWVQSTPTATAILEILVDFNNIDAPTDCDGYVNLSPCVYTGTHLDYIEYMFINSGQFGFRIRQFSNFAAGDYGSCSYSITWVKKQDLSTVSNSTLTLAGVGSSFDGAYNLFDQTYIIDINEYAEYSASRLVYWRLNGLNHEFVIYTASSGWAAIRTNIPRLDMFAHGMNFNLPFVIQKVNIAASDEVDGIFTRGSNATYITYS